MSFARQTKERLLEIDLKDCCGAAFCCGLLFSHAGRTKKSLLRTELPQLFGLLDRFYRQQTGEALPCLMPSEDKLPLIIAFKEPEEESRQAVLDLFGKWESKGGKVVPDPALLKKECCRRAFVRGLFVGCGMICDPEKEYHLELTFATPAQTEGVLAVLSRCKFSPKLTIRRGRYTLYFKESGQIEDFLAFIGDNNGMFELSNIRIYKDLRNAANRKTNCDMANLDRTVAVAARQVEDIRLIAERMGLDSLSDELKQTALLRLENSEMSLAQMSRELGIGRSGVNHRLKKLSELAESLRAKDKREGEA